MGTFQLMHSSYRESDEPASTTDLDAPVFQRRYDSARYTQVVSVSTAEDVLGFLKR